jgi:PAS domain S-box-containing protein
MANSKPTYEELEKRIAQLEAARGAAFPDTGEQLFSSEELQKRELRFQELVESSTDWIWEVDADSTYTYASPKVVDLLGYEPDEIIGRKPFDLMPPEEARRVYSFIAPIMAAGEPFSGLENVNRHKSGRTVYLETNGIPILSADGTLLGYRGIDRDVTKRRQVEEQLRWALQRLRLHVENSPMGVIEWGPDFRISHWNKESEHIFGWKAEEVLGLRIDDFSWVYEEDAGQVRRISEGLLNGTQPRSVSANRNYRKDGSVVFCEWYNSSLLDDSGRLISILSFVLDVTDRKQAQDSLEDRAQLLRLAVKTAGLAIWDWNLADDTVRWDESCDNIFGSAVEKDISYQWWVDHIHPEDREGVLGFLDRALHGDAESLTLEYRFLHPDGNWRTVYDRSHIIHENSGKPRRLIGAMLDVTNLRRAEQELRQSRDELEQAVQERTAELKHTVDTLHEEVLKRIIAERAARKRAEQLRALVSELTLAEQRERQRMGQVLHDGLQQLLVAAKLQLSTLAGLAKDPRVLESIKETDDLMDESLRVSRSLTAELGPPILHGRLIPALKWLASRMRDTHGLELELAAPDNFDPIPDHVAMFLFHAARELLFNVVKHAKVSKARVQLTRWNHRIELIVSDEGQGFNPGRARQKASFSAGIGLFGIEERLDFLGGRIEIDSAPGRGCRIRLVVPVEEKSK